MSRPIVIAYHLIWTPYGTWLPNDPRGSGSRTVRRNVLRDLGDLHFGRKVVQPPSDEIHAFYLQAVERLRYPVWEFGQAEQQTIGQAFARVVAERRYTCYACAVMPDHVHILLRKHRDPCEQMVECLTAASRDDLLSRKRPGDHPIWTAGHGWRVFLDHPDAVRRTIRYIESNPVKMGRPIQRWPFVTDYDGWPLHPGHSPQSPYAKRLRAAGRYPHDHR